MAFRQQEEMELQQAQEEAELLQQEDPFGNRHRRQFVGVPPRAEARAAWATPRGAGGGGMNGRFPPVCGASYSSSASPMGSPRDVSSPPASLSMLPPVPKLLPPVPTARRGR